jgi:hypothetical protein
VRETDLPDALPDGAKLLHIGLPKSGTTALQIALHDARDELAAYDVRNVGRGWSELAAARFAAGRRPRPGKGSGRRKWERISEDFRTSQARCTFWSSEALSGAAPERVGHLGETLGTDTHVLVTTRPLASLLPSAWVQSLKTRHVASFDDTLEGELGRPGGPAGPGHVRRHSLRRLVEAWGAVFGDERLIFFVPDPADRLRNFRAFEALLGVPEVLRAPEVGNTSLPFPEAELLRHFNLANAERGADLATWADVVHRGARQALWELPERAEPARLRLPRWAAERCNEITADWIEAVEASDALVVGDLRHLLVDPADHPEEVATPDRVSVDTAGWLMDQIYRSALDYDAHPREPAPAPEPTLDRFSAKELVVELRHRAVRRFRR